MTLHVHIHNIYALSHNQHASHVYIVRETSYLELPLLERHQLWNMTSCIPTSSTNLSITYTAITTIETQTLIIGVTISKSLQEVLQLDLY